MFANIRADIYHYREYCFARRPIWQTLLILPYVHPASVAVAAYRYGYWAWHCPIPIVRHLAKLVYLLIMPWVRLYSGVQIQPLTDIGPGLIILHFGGVVLTKGCRVGANAILHHNFNIVTTNTNKAAIIGDNFYAGVGASIVGNLIIEDNVVVGAGCVVTRSVPKDAIVGGVPARILRFRTTQERPPKIVVGNHEPAEFLESPSRSDSPGTSPKDSASNVNAGERC